jgi:hypothetical protein
MVTMTTDSLDESKGKPTRFSHYTGRSEEETPEKTVGALAKQAQNRLSLNSFLRKSG